MIHQNAFTNCVKQGDVDILISDCDKLKLCGKNRWTVGLCQKDMTDQKLSEKK